MGADLYIKNLPTKTWGFEVSKQAIKDGYFRDCYNGFGLFARLSNNQDKYFSWWQISDRKELFRKNGDMTVKGAKILLSEIKQAKSKLNLDGLVEREYIGHDKYNTYQMDEEHKQDFLDHLDLFIEFLEVAIKLKKPIEWSV